MKLPYSTKKILAITLITIFAVVELLFFGVLIVTLFANDAEGKGETILSFIFVMAIFAFPLWSAWSLWKSVANNVNVKAERIDQANESRNYPTIRVEAKLELKAYRLLLYKLTYTTPAFQLLHVIGMTMLLFYIRGGDGVDWFVYFILIFFLYLPIAVYRSAGSNYKATKSLHEPVSYEFSSDNIFVAGKSFTSNLQWQTLHKIRELGDWFMLYTNRQTAMIIPKKAFASEDDIRIFRHYCKGIPA